MNRRFVLVVVLVLVIDWLARLRGRGRARVGSWSQCMRKKRKGALHEPPGEGTGPTGCRPGPLTRRVERFMVPMHAEIVRGLSMNRRRPARFWIAPGFWRFGNGGEPTKSARGLAQSKTLPRDPRVQGPNACG